MKTYKDWADKLTFAIMGYNTTIRSATGETPYSLVFGGEAVLTVESRVQSLRVVLEAQISEAQ